MVRAPSLLFAVALALAGPARAAEQETLTICGEPESQEQEAAIVLSRWMRSARIEVRRCATEAPARRLAFEAAGAAAVLRLHTPTSTREREVPWLDRVDQPLARLRARSALAKVSVLIEALLAEDRLAAPPSTSRVAPELPKPPPSAPAPPAKPVAKPAPKPVALSPVAVAPLPLPLPLADAPSLIAGPAGPGLGIAPREASREPWPISIEGAASYRFRTPSLSTWEFGGGLRVGPILLGVTYQPESTWDLQGRALGMTNLGFLAGGRFELLESGGFYGGALGTLRLEYLTVYRRDTLKPFAAFDLGISGGLFGGSRLGPVGVELRVEAVLVPTAHLVEIPEGPSERLNLFGARASLCLFWDAWRL